MFMAEYRAFINAEKARKGMSWAYISEKTGMPETTVRKIFSGETSNPSYDSVESLKELFGTPKDPEQREAVEQELHMVKLKDDAGIMGEALRVINETYKGQIDGLKLNLDTVNSMHESRNKELKESLQKTIDAVTSDRKAWQTVALIASALLLLMIVIDLLMVFVQ